MSYTPAVARIAAPLLIPNSHIRENFSVVDLIQTGIEEYTRCPTTPAARLQLLDTYPGDDETFTSELNGLYKTHLTKHALYIGEKALYTRDKERSPDSRPDIDVLSEPTILALALGSVLVYEQIERIEEMEARFGHAGGKLPLLHSVTKAVHYKNGPLQRLVTLQSPDSPLFAEDFVDATNRTLLVSARDTVMTVLGDAEANHTPESVTGTALMEFVAIQTAAERNIFNQAMQSLR
jgi:hypothetical protein